MSKPLDPEELELVLNRGKTRRRFNREQVAQMRESARKGAILAELVKEFDTNYDTVKAVLSGTGAYKGW